MRVLGTAVALVGMPTQRRHSREYLTALLGRQPSSLEVFRHFFAFEEFLMLKLRVVNGRVQTTRLAPDANGFIAFMASGRPALLGSFHLGHSDLLGFLFGSRYRHRVFMVRQRVANSHDTDKLLERFGEWLKIIWVNDQSNLLFALKDAVAAGGSVAMKCDRLEFSAKTEVFDFLGARRVFPFTIYHLALIFNLPVVMSFGLPGSKGESVVHSSSLWEPRPGATKAENLQEAHAHFQSFLDQVETALRTHPYQWFNFTPLNPVAA
jgi:predicted LPLAT superfamily acyltransferase